MARKKSKRRRRVPVSTYVVHPLSEKLEADSGARNMSMSSWVEEIIRLYYATNQPREATA